MINSKRSGKKLQLKKKLFEKMKYKIISIKNFVQKRSKLHIKFQIFNSYLYGDIVITIICYETKGQTDPYQNKYKNNSIY